MGALIYFLLGVLFLAICEWFYLKKIHNVDARHEEPSVVKDKMESLVASASSLAGSASASAVNMGDKVKDIPAVSKGRAFLERMAAKEAQEKTDGNAQATSESSDQNPAAAKQDKTSITTTRAMAKKVSVASTTSSAESGSSSKAETQATTSSLSATASTPSRANSNTLDDLQKVSGIGPKIHELLEAEGIKSFETLAKTNVATLSSIMQKAGPRYALADVSSWPEQAKMLAKGDLEALKMLQQSLKKA